MKVFISWSGKLSRQLALTLRKYLPLMIQGLEPFMSKHDLESGARWSIELSNQLENSNFGILCITPDNLSSPWLLYEAGALTKMIYGRACGILFNGLTPAEVTGPLAQFQHRKFEIEDMKALMTDLNSQLEKPLEESQLGIIFEKFWSDLAGC